MTLSEDARTLWQTAEALALKARAVSPQARPLPPLLFFTDPERTPDPAATLRGLPPGAAIVYRHFGAPEAPELAQDLRRISEAGGIRLIIGLDHALAEAVGADGVHLPERALDQAPELRRRHPDWLITGTVHTQASLRQTRGLDAAVVSPVFRAGGRSATKPDLGLEAFRTLIAQAPCPIYGLGGITPERVPSLLDTGACGIAGVDAIQSAFSSLGSA